MSYRYNLHQLEAVQMMSRAETFLTPPVLCGTFFVGVSITSADGPSDMIGYLFVGAAALFSGYFAIRLLEGSESRIAQLENDVEQLTLELRVAKKSLANNSAKEPSEKEDNRQ